MAMMRARSDFRMVSVLGCLLAAWLAGPAPAAKAHEVKEMTIAARVHADRTDLVIVTSNHLAAAILAGTDGKPPVLNATTLRVLRPLLEEQGKKLCFVSTDEKDARPLAPTAIDVLLGHEDEVEFFIAYPPVGRVLHLEAAVLGRLEPGCVVNLTVLDTKRKPLATKALTREDAGVTVPLAETAAKSATE